jgi:hypothetical protein
MSTENIERALTQSAQRKPKAVVLAETTIRITQEPIVIKGSGELSFTRAADSNPAVATLLLWDPKIGAFRPVLTPPGKSFELVEKQQGPSIWRPGMPT